MNIKPPGAGHSALYTELNELKKITKLSKEDNAAALQQVAQQFEQVFMSMLVKSMREANESFGEDNFMNSSQTKFYQDMLDQQMTMELANNGGMGLADVLVQQLSRATGPVSAAEQDENTDKPFSQSQAERLLNRAVDASGNMAADTLLQQITALDNERPPEAPVAVVGEDSGVAQVQTPTQIQATEDETLPARFQSPDEFVQSLMPLAQSVAGEIGVDPKVLLAQAALETGWGKFLIQRGEGGSSHNLFNIKADSRWDGDRVVAKTLEFKDGVPAQEQAAFRAYGNYEQSFRDYISFLKNSPRYQLALQSAGDPYAYVQQLQQAGYATDPKYAEKITNILDGELMAAATSDAKRG